MSWLNIQQQVQKNKDDIAAWNDVDKFGIKVQGKVADEASLPNPETYQGEYGDTYAVGTDTPYDYYVFTRPESGDTYPRWFNVGQLQVKGDKGDQGETGPAGPTGERGSLWTTSNSNPSVMSTTKKNDQHLCVYNGDVFQFDGSAWNRIGNIRGPQGIQGVQGIQGPKGDTGETGPKGDTGDVGGFINIVATLTSADLLPDPATLDNLTYAYLVGDNNDLYIQIGKTSDEAHWKNMGSFNLTANHWTVNTSNQLVPANNDDVAVNNLTVLGTSSLKSPSISGVASCSAISSPATLTLSGTDGAEVLVNGTNELTVNGDGISLPTLADPGDNQSYPVLMADSDGKILKNTGIGVNPYTKALTADQTNTVGLAVGANGMSNAGITHLTQEIIFDANATSFTFNSCGIMRHNEQLVLSDYNDNGIAISKIGSNNSVIKQAKHSGGLTYTLPSASGTLALTTDTAPASTTLKTTVNRTTSGAATPTELGHTKNCCMYFDGSIKPTIDNPPLPNGINTDFTMTTQNWDNSAWATQVAYLQADSRFNQMGLAIRTIGMQGTPLWTDQSAGGWCYLANRNTDNTFSGENTFTGKTYVNTGIGKARIGAEYLNSDSKWGVNIPLTTQTAVAYRITSCGPKDDACILSALTSSTGGAVFESTIGELCDTFGNVLTIVFNQDGIYINRKQVSTESSTGYLQITGYAGAPIIIEQLI